MSTSQAENPTPGIVTFTAQGNRALDRLAAGLVYDCDGSPASIADVLERVLSADIAELADALSETTRSSTAAQGHGTRADHEISETRPSPESPDQAARWRLAQGEASDRSSMSPPAPPSVGR